MKTNRRIRTLGVLLCMVSMLVFSGTKTDVYAGNIAFVVLNTYEQTMNIGDEYRLCAVRSNGKKPTFSPIDSKIASVNTYGLITAKKAGTAKIIVKTRNAEARCRITVNKTTIDLNQTSVSMDNGSEFRLKAEVSTGHEVKYKSSKRSVATVDESGVITAVKPGDAVITVSADGSTATCRIKVKQPKVMLSQSKATLYRKEELQLTIHTNSRTKPKWKSNRSSVATVDAQGHVTAMKHGTAIITVTVDGVSKTCEVTVRQPKVVLAKSSVVLNVGQQTRVEASVSSGNMPVYSSSNTSIATVEEDGTVTAVSQGKAYIYATEDGVKAKLTVTVKSDSDKKKQK